MSQLKIKAVIFLLYDNIHLRFQRNSTKFDPLQLIQKKKSVLWIYSNCGVKYRNIYAKELQSSGVKINIFGSCGKRDPCNKNQKCLNLIFQQYRLYFAFENSQCFDYITEKAWTSLSAGMVPIISGATMENCQYHLPPDSYLHKDNFSSSQKLADYLTYLQYNNVAYLRYHEWRKHYVLLKPDFINCILCKSAFEHKLSKIKNKSNWWTFKKHCH